MFYILNLEDFPTLLFKAVWANWLSLTSCCSPSRRGTCPRAPFMWLADEQTRLLPQRGRRPPGGGVPVLRRRMQPCVHCPQDVARPPRLRRPRPRLLRLVNAASLSSTDDAEVTYKNPRHTTSKVLAFPHSSRDRGVHLIISWIFISTPYSSHAQWDAILHSNASTVTL